MGGNAIVTSYRRIAHISRVRGLTGEVVVVPTSSLPFHIWEQLPLWVVPPDHGLIRRTGISKLGLGSKAQTLYLTLEGVSDVTTARRLVGRSLLAQVEDGDCGDTSDEDTLSFVGLRVEDKTVGFIGQIVEERMGVAQTLLVAQGPFGEVLIPAVDEFIMSRDDKTVFTDLPLGLIELNR